MQKTLENFFFVYSILFHAFFVTITCDLIAVADVNRGRIVQGDEAKIDQFPWSALVICNNNVERSTCSGSLISEAFVLTAAHCVDRMVACVVEVGIVGKTSEGGSSLHKSRTKLYKHSCYRTENEDYYRYDIALLELESTVNLDVMKSISVIGLPANRKESIEGLATTAVGWGNVDTNRGSDVLRYTRMTVLPDKKCLDVYWIFEDPFLTCAVAKNVEQMVCVGDSGGPLVDGEGDNAVQVGITLFILDETRECISPKTPQGFLKVQPLLDWIQKTMEAGTDRGADNKCETWKFKNKNSVTGFGTLQDVRCCVLALAFNVVVCYFILS